MGSSCAPTRWHAFSWHVVAVVLTTFVVYVTYTVNMTGKSADLRKIANNMGTADALSSRSSQSSHALQPLVS